MPVINANRHAAESCRAIGGLTVNIDDRSHLDGTIVQRDPCGEHILGRARHSVGAVGVPPADDGPARAGRGQLQTSWSSQSRISLDRVRRPAIAPMIGCWTSARDTRDTGARCIPSPAMAVAVAAAFPVPEAAADLQRVRRRARAPVTAAARGSPHRSRRPGAPSRSWCPAR